MTPGFQRTLRELRLPTFVALSLVVVTALELATRRLEKGSVRTQSVCARLVDEAFGLDAARTPDSVLLTRLLDHRSRCTGDTTYLDRARQLMLDVHRIDDARALIADAERSGAIAKGQLEVQRAWIDLEESRQALRNGDARRAATLRTKLVATTNWLRTAWPEWAPPYVILTELERMAPIEGVASLAATENASTLERAAHRRVTSGAIVRSLSVRQTYAAVFALAVLGMLGFGAAARGVVASHGMRRMPTLSVADARAGYVELAGTLHLPPRGDAVIAPLSKASGVWYAHESSFASRGSRTWRERSTQRFVLRDATGEVAIDPSCAVVRTRHVSQFGSVFTPYRRETERMLRDGDAAYVVGELELSRNKSGAVERSVRAPEDGRQLLVSNYTEKELIVREWLWVLGGLLLCGLATASLMWGYVQRYEVHVMP